MKYTTLLENLSVDKNMVPYFGRHPTKQFIRGKPIRYGYKMWCVCDPLGYLLNFEPYPVKQAHRKNMDLGVDGSVVRQLLSNFPRYGPFKIYADRYFSSLELVNRLQELRFGYTSTTYNS